MRRQGGRESRGSDRGSSGRVWQKVLFELAKPTHLTAAVRCSRPESYRTREIGLSHQIHSSAVSCITPCSTWQSLLCLAFWGSHREALPGPAFLTGIVIFCCLFIASWPLYLNHPLSLKVLCPAYWCIDIQQLYPLWLHFAGCTV